MSAGPRAGSPQRAWFTVVKCRERVRLTAARCRAWRGGTGRRLRATTLATGIAVMLAACSSSGPRSSSTVRIDPAGSRPAAVSGRTGAYYLDDGPGAGAPADLDAIPNAVPRAEPLLARANRPYTLFDRQYEPMTRLAPFRERGPGSWYGRKYHGQRTSSGEVYDMYAMTAAHPTLPIPSYARVTHTGNGRSVVVRVNDRGPFLYGRIIDLSYTAAAKLGYVNAGSAPVEVELITQFDAPAPAADVPAAAVAVRPVAPSTSVDAPVAQPERLEVEMIIAPVAPAAAASAAAPSGGIYLQLGAFSSMDNAQAAQAHIARQLDWMAGSIDVRADADMFKVQAGPYAQRDDALAAAERIRLSTGFKPFAVAR